jgi:hypothetical protein
MYRIGRWFLIIVLSISIVCGPGMLPGSQATETVPPEPENLDEPTPWQEGDPEPVEITVPAQEPEQTSKEAPPCQPIDDERPPQPGSNYV